MDTGGSGVPSPLKKDLRQGYVSSLLPPPQYFAPAPAVATSKLQGLVISPSILSVLRGVTVEAQG